MVTSWVIYIILNIWTPMHVINYSRDSEVSGAGFWVWMVSRVSFQGLYDRVSLQSLHGGPNITWQITKSTAIFGRNLVKPSSYIFRVNIKWSWESSSQNQAITAHSKPNQILSWSWCSLVPSPLHACARKGLVKRVALTRPVGMQ